MRLVQFTDLHLFDDPETELYGVVPEAFVRRTWARIKELNPAPDAIMLTGYLTHDDSPSGYDRISELMNELGKPTFWVPGNHDDRVAMHKRLVGCLSAERSVELGQWQLILLDSQWTGEVPGELSGEQFDFLRTSLEACAERDAYVLIALHHPPFKIGSRWIDNYRLLNDDKFWEIADKFPCLRAVVSGHVHQEFVSQRGDVQLLTTPAACMQFAVGTDDPEIDLDSLPGFRIFDLGDGGSFETEVVRVEADS